MATLYIFISGFLFLSENRAGMGGWGWGLLTQAFKALRVSLLFRGAGAFFHP